MNLLSLLSAMLATAFLIGGFYCLTRNRKSIMNVFSFLVLVSLGWWSFCNAFLFSAETEATLWRWHHLASLGWTGFIAETTYYFIALIGLHEKMKKLWIQLLFYLLPAILMLHNLFGETTSLAVGFVKSSVGGEWTYVNTLDNPWLWLYMVCLVTYFAFSFYLLLQWSSQVKHKLKKRMAIGFVILDALTILFGFITDVFFPLTQPLIPAVANLCTAFFGAGYFLIILHFDLFNVHFVVADREIIEHSMESILVTDEGGEILFCNRAGAELLENGKNRIIGQKFSDYLNTPKDKMALQSLSEQEGEVKGIEASVHTKRGKEKQLLISAAVIRDKQHEYLGTVISLRDITQLSLLKEQYRIKSDEYQRLAFVDPLTGLPNRRKTFEMLAEHAKAYKKDHIDFFVLYMDLDRFKEVNDQYGHNIGDQFLKKITERLNGCLYAELHFLGRLSGDEFLMIGKPNTSEETKAACVERIKRQFKEEFIIGNHHIQSDISVGYARYSDFNDIDAMVHSADKKMYTVKQVSHTRTR